jgi:hypothetical protein
MVGRGVGMKKGVMGGDDALFFTIPKTILPPNRERGPGKEMAPKALHAMVQDLRP